MRIGVVRSDISRVYLSDVENRSQRCFSSEPIGQSRYFHKPSDVELKAVLSTYAFLSALGTNASATIATNAGANVFRIRASSAAPFTVITVTSSATASKAQIMADLNAAFLANGLPFVVSSPITNRLQIDTIAPNSGTGAYLEIDTAANGSTLNALGFTAGWATVPPVLSGLAVSALKTAAYPTATTIDVSSATLLGLSTFNLMATKATLLAALQDLIAPKLVETGPTMLSFVYGVLSKMRVASFQPGNTRAGLPAGIGVAIVLDDGTTPYVI